MKFSLTLVLFWILNAGLSGQDTLKSTLEISLLTCDPGEEIYSIFGHTAIRVYDLTLMIDEVYNYGTFNSFTDGFIVKFLRGKLMYTLSVSNYSNFLREYVASERGVIEQKFQLTEIQKAQLLAYLRNNALPQNAEYLYDFFYDNCSSRINLVIKSALDQQINYPEDDNLTYRQMIHQYLTTWPWTKFGIDLIIGSKADKLTGIEGQMFLPDHLSQILSESRFEGDSTAILSQAKIVLDFPDDPRGSTNWPLILFSLTALMPVAFLLLKQDGLVSFFNAVVFSILGLSSLIILFMWFGTDHGATKANFNIVWISPIYLTLPFLDSQWKKWISYVCLSLLLICILPLLPQDMPTENLMILIFACLITTIFASRREEKNHGEIQP